MLKVKLLHPDAMMPTVAHPGTDLGYDLYALEDTILVPGKVTVVRTGISASMSRRESPSRYVSMGLLIKDRSSMAFKGITVSAGVIDVGYTDEIKVLMTFHGDGSYLIEEGQKIAQMLPTEVFTAESIIQVEELDSSARGKGGFGSTGA